MRLLGVAMVVLLSSAALSLDVGAQEMSGLEGKVLRGPVSPVCREARPCQVPAAIALSFRRYGREIARVKSTKSGSYRIALAPGGYSVTPAYRHPLWRISPQRVRVPVGRYARVNFLIDTGIR
jgi:hypothetical protein